MSKSRVWIHFTPQIYTDLFKRIIQSNDLAEIIDTIPLGAPIEFDAEKAKQNVDLVIFSLDLDSQLEMVRMADQFPQAEFVAFSLTGDYGLKRNPGEEEWLELRPFGIHQMLAEVISVGRKTGR